ncbi:dolichyl-phosphate-mannose--protein mannosyltransferase [Streptomyces apocyni]|uniref:dolichyl-phosphate-mannose--protein mannosyltransferase n=1 Tax=Streptomyces apocyni TaxID=2654677 RepID=UPI0012EAB9B1|nr:phospholipid carrier-dependent glycosyltransferase [Streptomyces apocyni]
MTSTASSTDARQGRGPEKPPQPQEPPQPQPPTWQRRLRRFGYVAPPRTDVKDRLVPPYAEPSRQLWTVLGVPAHLTATLNRVLAWVGPLLIALFAGMLRFWQLGKPHAVIFDETYYAKDAWALIHRGYEVKWPDDINDKIIADPSSVPVPTDPSYVVHPPVGKWVIGLGEWLYGFTPFGWRFMVAVLGTLSVLMLCRIGRRLFRSTFLGCLAGALLAVDGLHFVMSRTALLDLPLMFFILAAFGCLVIDRDKARERLAAALPTDADGTVRADAQVASTLRLGWRPWRIAAGVCLGLACATKWNGLYVLAAFGLLTVLWDVGARRVAGARQPYLAVLTRDLVPGFVATVPVAIVTYVASWSGWLITRGGYYRDWAAEHGKDSGWSWLPDWLQSLWHYEVTVYEFHVNLTSGHRYDSSPWSWIVMGRPVSYFYESPEPGTQGCPADTPDKCASEVLALGTPLLWWAGCFAILYVLWRWVFRRDWRAGAILCGIAAGYLPWLLYQERTIFVFYAVVFVPFLCLALAMMIGAILGPPGSSERRRMVGAVGSGVLVLLIVWNFVYFWPLYTGEVIPADSWRARMWLDTWI